MAKGKFEYWLTDDGLLLLAGWARDGLTDVEMSAKMGITRETLRTWKNTYSAISDTLKKNKEIVDTVVESALLDKCTGCYVDKELAFKCKEVYYDEEGRRCEREEIKTVMVKDYIPPETMAMLAWLNNRQSKKWRRNAGKEKLDEQKFEHDKDIDGKKYF